jgi:hypothetical protein
MEATQTPGAPVLKMDGFILVNDIVHWTTFDALQASDASFDLIVGSSFIDELGSSFLHSLQKTKELRVKNSIFSRRKILKNRSDFAFGFFQTGFAFFRIDFVKQDVIIRHTDKFPIG